MEAIMSSPEQRRIIWDRRKALLDERTLLAEAKAEGREESEMDSIRNLMETMKLSAQKAMDALKIDPTRREKYLAMLK